jgi:hypothetical protein
MEKEIKAFYYILCCFALVFKARQWQFLPCPLLDIFRNIFRKTDLTLEKLVFFVGKTDLTLEKLVFLLEKLVFK